MKFSMPMFKQTGTYADDGTNHIVVTKCILQRLHDDNPEAFTSTISIGLAVEAVASSIWTQEPLARQGTPEIWHKGETGPCNDAHAGRAIQNIAAGFMKSNHARGASRVNGK